MEQVRKFESHRDDMPEGEVAWLVEFPRMHVGGTSLGTVAINPRLVTYVLEEPNLKMARIGLSDGTNHAVQSSVAEVLAKINAAASRL